MKKSKFDKRKCYNCMYHGIGKCGYSVTVKGERVQVFCDYANITGNACIKPGPHGSRIDLRGDDYGNCKLYQPGGREKTTIGVNHYEGRG